jgi:hypothetical protein
MREHNDADVAMIQRLSRKRALRDITRHLADSDPQLDQLFFCFNQHVRGEQMPRTEKIWARLRRWLPRMGRRVRAAAYGPQHQSAAQP